MDEPELPVADTSADHDPSLPDGHTTGVRSSRLGRLSLTGAILGTLAAWVSVLPSLVPRAWVSPALLTGLCLATCYGIGSFLGWAYRRLPATQRPSPHAGLDLARARGLGSRWFADSRLVRPGLADRSARAD